MHRTVCPFIWHFCNSCCCFLLLAGCSKCTARPTVNSDRGDRDMRMRRVGGAVCLFFMLYLFCANRPLICMPPKTKMYYKSALKRIPIQQHVNPVDLLVGQTLKNTQTGRPYLRSGIAKRCLPWHQAEYWRIRGTPRDAVAPAIAR